MSKGQGGQRFEGRGRDLKWLRMSERELELSRSTRGSGHSVPVGEHVCPWTGTADLPLRCVHPALLSLALLTASRKLSAVLWGYICLEILAARLCSFPTMKC